MVPLVPLVQLALKEFKVYQEQTVLLVQQAQ
jgi:hypothetical protein